MKQSAMRPQSPSQATPVLGYGDVAAHYDSWPWQAFWHHNERPMVIELLRAKREVSLGLDLGVGTGRYLAEFNRLGVRAVGLDISEHMLHRAGCRLGSRADLLCADMNHMPFASASFDLVVAARVFSHLPRLLPALAEIGRVLRHGGLLIVTDVDGRHRYDQVTVPTPTGKVPIVTYKRSLTQMLSKVASVNQWRIKDSHLINAMTASWLPPLNRLTSIDRTGRRPVGYLIAVEKV